MGQECALFTASFLRCQHKNKVMRMIVSQQLQQTTYYTNMCTTDKTKDIYTILNYFKRLKATGDLTFQFLCNASACVLSSAILSWMVSVICLLSMTALVHTSSLCCLTIELKSIGSPTNTVSFYYTCVKVYIPMSKLSKQLNPHSLAFQKKGCIFNRQ